MKITQVKGKRSTSGLFQFNFLIMHTLPTKNEAGASSGFGYFTLDYVNIIRK